MSRAEATRTVGWLRRRMPRHLLPALHLSLLLLLGCACGPTHTVVGAVNGVSLFTAGTTKVPENMADEDLKRDVASFASPFLVGGSGVMVALAEAQHTGGAGGKENVDIVARYIETEGQGWVEKFFENHETNWKTQLALQGKEGVHGSVLRNPTAVFRDDKIFLLALNRMHDNSQSDNGWQFELAVGEITGQVGSKKIEWKPSDSLLSGLTQEVKNKGLTVFPGSGNSAFLRSKGTAVFSANATKEKNGTMGYAVMQLTNEKQWEVSFVENPGECPFFSVYEWKDRLFSIFSGCSRGTRYVQQYDEVTKEWEYAHDALFYALGNKQTSRDMTRVTIGNKTWLLFTDARDLIGAGGPLVFHLFFTDGIRVSDSSHSIRPPYAKITSGGLLHTNDELFFMYQDASKPSGDIVFEYLVEQAGNIIDYIETWDKNDAYLSKPCSPADTQGASPESPCVTPVSTVGLIGFLSNRGNRITWIDEYDYLHANVKGGTKVKNGMKLSGSGAGVEWKLAQGNEGKRYDFTKYGLTVEVTVTVHETPKDDVPLLTVSEDGGSERWGLWYKAGQWKVVSKNGKEESAVDLVIQKAYRVALKLRNNTISVYVDGKLQGSPLPLSASGEKPFDVQTVFIGGYKHSTEIDMTATNALLYDQALSETELEELNKETFAQTTDLEKPTDQATGPTTGQSTETSTGPNENSKESTGPNENSKESTGPNENSKESTGPKQTTERRTDPEDSSVLVRMGVTPLFLLGSFCLAVFV